MIEPVLLPEDGFRRLKIEFAYDGTNFNGYAKQKDDLENSGALRTVQSELEKALTLLAHAPVLTVVAGRTDAGVHATQQFVHSDIPLNSFTNEPWDISNWQFRLNSILKEDIRIINVETAPKYFHARFSAISRSYRYVIADGNNQINPLTRHMVTPWYRDLDCEKMDALAKKFIGESDFFAFCKYRQGASTIRTISKFDVFRNDQGLVQVEITGDAFCYNMVRSLVGALVAVGEGRFEPEWALEILSKKVRPSNSYVFPSRGLTLTNISYPPDEELLERAKQTISRRDE